jgi:hypothetical protein
VVVFLDCPED